MKSKSLPTVSLEKTGYRIRELREERGLSTVDLSTALGFVNHHMVNRWERGDAIPSIDNLLALSYIFDTCIDNIIVADEPMANGIMIDKFYVTELDIYKRAVEIYGNKDLKIDNRVYDKYGAIIKKYRALNYYGDETNIDKIKEEFNVILNKLEEGEIE